MQVRALQRSEDEASSFCSAINQTEAHRCRRTAHLRDWGPDPPRPPVDTLCPGLRRVSAPRDRQVALVVHVATAAPTLGRLGRAVSRRSRGCLQPLTAPCYPHPHLPPAGTGSRWWSCCWLHRPARPWLVRATRSSRRATQPPTTKNQKPKTNTQQHPTQHPTQHPHVKSTSRSTSSHTLSPLLAAAHTSSCALAGVQHVHTARRRPRRRHARLALPVARRGPGLRATAARAAGVRLTGAP